MFSRHDSIQELPGAPQHASFPTAPSRVACLPEYFMYYNYLKRLGTYIIQIKHCPIRGLSTNLWKILVTRTRNLHPTHRRSLARFVESNVCTQAVNAVFE